MANTPFAAHLDFEGFLARGHVTGDSHIAVFMPERLVRAQAGVGHEQDEVLDLFSVPPEPLAVGRLGVSPRRLVKLLVFIRAKPWAMR